MTIKAPLQAKISTLISEIKANPHTIEEARDFNARYAPLIKKLALDPKALTKEDSALINEYYSDKNMELRSLMSKTDQLESFRKTMMLDLVKVNTDWVVTDGETLISPAGFHPSERVVVRHDVMICMNEKPTSKNVPSSNVKLYGHKMPSEA